MKRIWPIIALALVLALVMGGCSSGNPEAQGSDTARLEYPGTHWLDVPDAVYGKLLSDIPLRTGDAWVDADFKCPYFTAENMECLGATASSIRFNFCRPDVPGYYYELFSVWVFYPEDTDMAAVRDALVRLYGEGSQTNPSPDGAVISPRSGILEPGEAGAESGNRLYWSVSAEDAVPKSQRKAFLKDLKKTVEDETIRAQTEADYLSRPAVTITWSDSGAPDLLPQPTPDFDVVTSNCVIFDASMLTYFQHNFG